MILKGNSRANGQELAHHLMNVSDNEHVRLHHLRGFSSGDIFGAFKEVEAISSGTKCQQYLFSLSLNPPQHERVSVKTFEAEIAEVEKTLGLVGQPRAIVFHEKNGRRHAHCVWSRIDVNQMKAINLPHYKRRLMDVSREIYLRHNWNMPAGLQNSEDRNPSNYTHAEAGQAKRLKRNPDELKQLFQQCFAVSDSRSAFAAALWEKGYSLARGDRRGFVAVDKNGQILSLSRWGGVKPKELRRRFGNGDDLPSVEQAVKLRANKPEQISGDTFYAEQRHVQEVKVANLVNQQRAEKQALSDEWETRRIKLLKQCQETLPAGLKAVWGKLNGTYQARMQDIAKQVTSHDNAASLAEQSLIERHLAQRQALDDEFEIVRLKHELKNETLQPLSTQSPKSYSVDPRQHLVIPHEKVSFTTKQLLRNPALILDHISQKEAHFNRNDIIRALAKFIDDPLDLRAATELALVSNKLAKYEKGDAASDFTTVEFKKTETQLADTVSSIAQSGGYRVATKHVKQAIKRENKKLKYKFGAKLSDEQVKAIHHILEPNQLSSAVGLAGSGKSTLLAVAREAWEAQGFNVHGLALAGKAADGLESASGIQSRTIASLEASWNHGYEPVAHGSVVVIDEAGMVGSRQLQRVAEALQLRGCKLVLVGDPEQLQPIEAGNPFRDIVETTNVAKLTEIRRQSSDWQRQASSDFAAGLTETALQSYADHGYVQKLKNREHAIYELVNAYVADCEQNTKTKTRLALAHRRKDVHAINQAIHLALREKMPIEKELLFNTDHGPRAFAKGDRILFTQNDRDLGVRNGMLGSVIAISDNQIRLLLDVDNSNQDRELEFNTSTYSSFDHGYAVTIHRAQGCTVDNSFVLSSKTMDKNLTYVAMTRHRKSAKFFTAPDIQKIERRMDQQRNQRRRDGPKINR